MTWLEWVLIVGFFWALVKYSSQKLENKMLKTQLDSYIEDRGDLIKKLDAAVDENLKLNRQLNG
jgi:hypothetical protein